MARTRKSSKSRRRPKPGRETQRHSQRTPKRARSFTAAQRKLYFNNIVDDRVAFLERDTFKKISFKTRKEAVDFAVREMLETGIDYNVPKGKTFAVRERVDRRAVQESSSMKRILADLKTGGTRRNSKRANALEQLGRRESFFDWPVGETPP